MGSWYKTCGMSGLPIYEGDPVYVFVLKQNMDFTERCYTTALWSPSLLPFLSTYADYGGGENSDSVEFRLIIDALKTQIIEMDVGENQYHDIAVKRDALNEELFFEAVHESRLMVPNWQGKGALIDFVMMRKDVVDRILETHVIEDYVGDGKGTCGYNNNYIQYNFADVIAGLPEFLAEVKRQLSGNRDAERELLASIDHLVEGTPEYKEARRNLARILRMRMGHSGLSDIYDWKDRTITSRYFCHDGHRYFRIVNTEQIIIELLADGKDEEAYNLAKSFLTGAFIECFMSECRKVWIPACHEGSQAQELRGYKTLIGAIDSAIKAEEKRWEDDEE